MSNIWNKGFPTKISCRRLSHFLYVYHKNKDENNLRQPLKYSDPKREIQTYFQFQTLKFVRLCQFDICIRGHFQKKRLWEMVLAILFFIYLKTHKSIELANRFQIGTPTPTKCVKRHFCKNFSQRKNFASWIYNNERLFREVNGKNEIEHSFQSSTQHC